MEPCDTQQVNSDVHQNHSRNVRLPGAFGAPPDELGSSTSVPEAQHLIRRGACQKSLIRSLAQDFGLNFIQPNTDESTLSYPSKRSMFLMLWLFLCPAQSCIK